MSDMGYDDLDDDVDTPDTGAPGQTDNNSVMKQMRQAIKDANRRAKEAEAAAAEAAAHLAEREAADRKAQLVTVATGLGLKPGQAALVPSDLEPTEQAVGEWAVAHELLARAEEPQEVVSSGFVPLTGSGGVAPDSQIDQATFKAMYANPLTQVAAEKLFLAGRVQGLDPNDPSVIVH